MLKVPIYEEVFFTAMTDARFSTTFKVIRTFQIKNLWGPQRSRITFLPFSAMIFSCLQTLILSAVLASYIFQVYQH